MTPAEALRDRGLLLLHDKRLCSVSLLVAGPVGGSWWSHPRGPDIFRAAEAIDDDDGVISAKLVAGKVTFVWRTLWPALARVATSRASWQREGLSDEAAELMKRVSRRALQSDGRDVPKRAVDALERRLLIHARQIHSDSGKHVKVLSSWRAFGKAVGLGALPPPKEAYLALERAADALDPDGQPVPLPWR